MSDILSPRELTMPKEKETPEGRKRAEEEIARLARFPSENPNPVLRVAKDGTILYANNSSLPLLNVWGCQVGQVLPDDWRKFTLDVFTSGSRKDAEVEYEDRILSLTFAPMVDADYVNVYGLNITERKRAEEEVRRRSEELLALNAIAQTVSQSLDLDEILSLALDRVSKTMGAKAALACLRDEATGDIRLLAHRGLPPPLAARFEELGLKGTLCQLVVDSGKPLAIPDLAKETRVDTTGLVKAGLASYLGAPLVAKGRVLGSIGIFGTTTHQPTIEEVELLTTIANQIGVAIENARLHEQTDEKLQHRVAELSALNAIAASLTSTLDLDEVLESIVTRVAQVMGARICTIRLVEGDELTIGAAVGYRDEPSRQHTIKIDERLARIVRDQKPLLIEDLWKAEDIPQRRRDRAEHEEVHAFLGVPMISREKTIGILSIYREEPHHFREEEVTLLSTVANQTAVAIERARLHERVREHAEDLEGLVQERTKELRAIHAELLRSAKLAALGQLAAGVAHELNNPLGAISGYLELLQEEVELGPREMDYMERIEKRIQQSTKIVADLRSVGIPSKPVWQIVNVNDILEEVLTLVEWRLSLHLIKVQKEMAPDLPLMHADPDRLEQVFINLITNAKQAMKEGGTLRVASRESRNGEWVEIIFADTGEGIAKSHLDKIFDPFFTTRRPGEAMGLGLSISHRQIKDHGGAIDVWSEKGRGAVFRVALPPSGAKRCWEILDCQEKERCKAVRENADYRCWTVMEDVSRCERCEVYRRKALPPLDGTLLPE